MDDAQSKLNSLSEIEGFSPSTEKVDWWMTQLQAQGFVLFPAANDVLRRYAGLEIKHRWKKWEVIDLRIDALFAGDGEFEKICPWESEAGSRLYPVGMIDGRIMVVAESGAVFAIDGCLYRLGGSIDEVISGVVTRRQARLDRPKPEKHGIPLIYEIIVVLIIVLMFGCLTLWGIENTPQPITTP